MTAPSIRLLQLAEQLETYAREDAEDAANQSLSERHRWFRVGRAEAYYGAADMVRKEMESWLA